VIAAVLTVAFGLLFHESGGQVRIAKRHIIVTASPYASEAGREILRQGGSAVDAAVAAQMVLTLVEPQSSGIGGGLYLLVSDARGHMRAYDGREKAPQSASPSMFLDSRGRPRPYEDIGEGGAAVGVPGAIAALALAHRQYGRLPWRRLFGPAIMLARSGFVVSPRLSKMIRDLNPHAVSPNVRTRYFHADGTPIAPGEVLRNLALAHTLQQIANLGPRAFYEGPIAADIVNAVNHSPQNPGRMTLNDLASYAASERTPLCAFYRAYRLCSVPPSTSGGVTVLEILGLLQRFRSQELQPNSLSAVHLITQASRLAYADRARWLGDPDFVQVPVQGLLDDEYLRNRARLINPRHDMGTATAGTPVVKNGQLPDFAPGRLPVDHGTSHLSVVDDRGEVVSMTMSVQDTFGAHIGAAGFVLNNQLTDFSREPVIDGHPVANAPGPGKRPLSAMGPFVLFDPNGKFFAAVGTQGGQNIIAYNAQVISALIDGRRSMPDAVALGHVVNTNGPTTLEIGTSLMLLWPRLELMGHTVRIWRLSSGLNGIRKVAHGYEGGSDPRGEGVASGD
jgi:gamma-glutamyltranspeptidase/glutathione hydrolase